MEMYDGEYYIFNSVLRELAKARKKFPKQDIWRTLAALTEEIGELNQKILEFHDEPDKDITLADIRKELVQSMTMLLRIASDCDLKLINADEK